MSSLFWLFGFMCCIWGLKLQFVWVVYNMSNAIITLKNMTILNRVNTYSDVAYKDELSIFVWELMNEPECTADSSGDTLQIYFLHLYFHSWILSKCRRPPSFSCLIGLDTRSGCLCEEH